MRSAIRSAVVLLCLTAIPQTLPRANGQETPDAATTDTDSRITDLVRSLGDPAYAERARATRALCMIGQRAAPALQKAAAGDEFEIALRARNLLEVIDSVYFGGCSIQLAADRTTIAWDQPFLMTATIRNDSGYRAHLPIELARVQRQDVAPDARQVGAMMDLSDYLHVVGPDGRQVNLRVDDIRLDHAVADAVEWRVEGGPVAELPPGRDVRIDVEAFNRGWARYPLLDRGPYRITFAYEPQWDDEEFRRAGVGQVSSNVLEIQVTEAAPTIVQRSRRPAQLDVERGGDKFVALLTNTDDLPVWINGNVQRALPPFAELRWTILSGETAEDLHAAQTDIVREFSRQRLTELPPGAAMQVGQLDINRVTGANLVQNLPDGQTFTVQATWINLTDVGWQQSQQPALIGNERADEDLRTPLPRRMLTGRFTCPPIELTAGKAGR